MLAHCTDITYVNETAFLGLAMGLASAFRANSGTASVPFIYFRRCFNHMCRIFINQARGVGSLSSDLAEDGLNWAA